MPNVEMSVSQAIDFVCNNALRAPLTGEERQMVGQIHEALQKMAVPVNAKAAEPAKDPTGQAGTDKVLPFDKKAKK